MGPRLSSKGFDEVKLSASSFTDEDQKTAREILKSCGNSWDNVRAKLLGSQRDTRIQQMYLMLEYRKRVVDPILEEVKAATTCDGKATGSTELTSDYDITFSAPKGSSSPARLEYEAVKMFHERFRAASATELGLAPGQELPSGVVFDTNAYALGEHLSSVSTRLEATPEQARDTFAQNKYALAKARKYMSAEEWTAFGEPFMATAFKREGSRRDVCASAESLFLQEFILPIHKRIAPQSPGNPGESNLEREARQIREVEAFAAERPHELAKLTDSLYITTLGEAVPIREIRDLLLSPQYKAAQSEEERAAILEAHPAWKELDPGTRTLGEPELTTLLRSRDSTARMMANEAYFSRGAIRHILPQFRAEDDGGLTRDDLFQSLNEQLGDALKKLHSSPGASGAELSGGDDSERARERAALASLAGSAKYVERLVDAAAQLLAQLPAPDHPDASGKLERELEAFSRMVALKPIAKDAPQGSWRKVDVRTLSDSSKWREAREIVDKGGVGRDVAVVRRRLISLVATLNARYFEIPEAPRGGPSEGSRKLRRS